MHYLQKIGVEIKVSGEPRARALELLQNIANAFERGGYDSVTAGLNARIEELRKDFNAKLQALEKKL